MLKRSLLILALSAPFTTHSLTIWEADNLIESVLKNATFKESDVAPIKQFITEKINNPDEIANLETILKKAEKTLQAQQKSCFSNNCLKVLDISNGIMGGFAGMIGINGVSIASAFIISKTVDLWVEHIARVNLLSQRSVDPKAIEVARAIAEFRTEANIQNIQGELDIIKGCAIAAGVSAAVFALAVTIEQKIKRIFNARDLIKTKLQIIRELIEYLRYEQGMAAVKTITAA